MEAVDEARLAVWKRQPARFFEEAAIDLDGMLVIVLCKNLAVEKGQKRLFDDYRFFFYITNDRRRSAEESCFDPESSRRYPLSPVVGSPREIAARS